MSEEDSFQDESDSDDDSISLLFNNVNNLTLEDDTDYIDDNNAAITQTANHQSQQQRKDNKRHKNRKAKKKHKQHSLEHLKQKSNTSNVNL